MLFVVAARYVRDYTVWLRFSDGVEGEVDLQEELWGPMFEPLKDVATFAKVSLNYEVDTIEWPNGADWAPESLHELLLAQRGSETIPPAPAKPLA